MNNINLRQYQIALSLLNGIGPRKARKLLQCCDCISDVFTMSYLSLYKQTGISIAILKNMNREKALESAFEYFVYIEKNAYQLFSITDPEYPRRLKNCEDAPLLLYGKGDLRLNTEKTIAVVGTRNATTYGKEVCLHLIKALADQNVTVISGMAYGIDICVHQLCVEHNLPTIGVLGHGLDRMYPAQHASVGKKMLKNGGLLTEFLPFTLPDKVNFPKRNRIVAGLADATIVVESKAKGGSLITAHLSNDYNREVFAVPGSLGNPYSEGCNALIEKNLAHIYLSPEKFLERMNWHSTSTPGIQQSIQWDILTDEQTKVCNVLQVESPLHLDILTQRTNLLNGQMGLVLFELEMQGMIRSLPGMMYTLSA